MSRMGSRGKRRASMKFVHSQSSRPDFRYLLWEKCPGHCWYCGQRLRAEEGTVDHLHPITLGGESTYSNCVLACATCNNAKGQKTLTAYRHLVGVAHFYGE